MEDNNLIKKGIAFAVILLFIGVAFAPSINANVSKASVDDELVEFTTEVCGIDGVKPYTVKLTKEDNLEVENLIDSIRKKLNNVESRKETIEIVNWAIEELDSYGLLGDLSVVQVQDLITKNYKNLRNLNYLKRLYSDNTASISGNSLCYISGETSMTSFVGAIITVLFEFLEKFNELGLFVYAYTYIIIFLWWYYIIDHWRYFNFFRFGNTICIGQIHDSDLNPPENIPGSGWINTNGVNGKKVWSGSLYGNLSMAPICHSGGGTDKVICFSRRRWFYWPQNPSGEFTRR